MHDALGRKQSDVARELGVNPATLSLHMSGKRSCSRKLQQSLIRKYGVEALCLNGDDTFIPSTVKAMREAGEDIDPRLEVLRKMEV